MVTWNQVASYTPTGGPIAGQVAPGVAGTAGWIDETGKIWSIDANNRLIMSRDTSAGSVFSNSVIRRAASEGTVNCRIRVGLAGTYSSSGVYPVLRVTGSQGTRCSYVVGFDSGGAFMGTLINNNFSALGRGFTGTWPTIDPSKNYVIDASAEQINSTTTKLTLQLFAADGVTLLATATLNDNNSTLQNVAGSVGVTQYPNGDDPLWPITSLTSYSDQTVATVLVPVSSAAFKFSPGNWKGDTGRGGSSYRKTWNPGAYFDVHWIAAANSPTAVLAIPQTGTGVMVSYIINGTLVDNVAANAPIPIYNILPGVENKLHVMLRNLPQTSRWNNGNNTLQINGLQLDVNGSAAGTAAAFAGWDIIVGDSLTEGIEASENSLSSFLRSWAYHFGQAIRDLGRDYSVNACGYSGYLRNGDGEGDVPPYYYAAGGNYNAVSRWDKIDAGVSLLDAEGKISAYGATGTQPANIWIVYGTNEALNQENLTALTTSVRMCLAGLRVAAPTTKINIVVPFAIYALTASKGADYAAAIRAGFVAYQQQAPLDTNISLIDFGAAFSTRLTSNLYGGQIIHGNAAMHALEAARMIPKLAANTNVGLSLPAYRPGFH